MLHKSKELNTLTLADIRKMTEKDSETLLGEVSKTVDRNLSASCIVESVTHYQAIKARIVSTKSKVVLNDSVKPGKTLIYKNEPTELKNLTYNQLKGAAYKKNMTYSGILSGTIKVHDCNKTVDCLTCSGSGICVECNGKKKVVCPVCDGELECVACNGTGRYTCRNCDWDGECPDCDDGWVTCDDCDGDGKYDCPDCDGIGNYIDEECNRCDGSGYYAPAMPATGQVDMLWNVNGARVQV